ncbi:hypothetical protein [Undibacterium sp.]|uniref:hypothetical protein n=1 Tax=Undibacterium sp. TaxID=1914977 RepID=UPI0025F352B0|nr:hypothetical protein [Undibacterium sp.]
MSQMKPLKIFIDTEYTNFIDTGLMSLGLVAENGEEAYFEVQYNETECSDFVREVVIPLLGREPHAMVAQHVLATKLMTWLEIARPRQQDIEICYDHQNDWNLFIDALDYRVPPWVTSRNVCYEIEDILYQDFFVREGLPEHHALYDARANAYAFRERVVE